MMTPVSNRSFRGLGICLMLATLVLSTTPVFAASMQGPKRSALELLKDGDAVRKRLLLREGRYSVAPSIGFTLNDAFSRTALVGAALRYNLSDTLSVGGSYHFGMAFDSSLAEDIAAKRPGKIAQGGFSSVSQVASVELGYTPLFGKLALFNRLAFNYDLQAIVGGGVSLLDGDGDLGTAAPMLVLGLCTRAYLQNGLGLTLQIRDHIYSSALNAVVPATSEPGSAPVAETEFRSQFAFMVGVEFIFPQQPRVGD